MTSAAIIAQLENLRTRFLIRWPEAKSRAETISRSIDIHMAQQDKIDRLTAKLEAMRKDAERYRWLRDKSNYSYKSAPCVVSGAMPSGDLTMLIEAELDAAIDKVMEAKP